MRERSTGCCEAVKVTDDVYWVGAIDWGVRDFHGYETPRGSTYNAYLVLADKVALIDTVKAPFASELLSRVASVIDPEHIDYVISNHAEMDHSGGLPEVIAAVRPEAVFASSMGVKALGQHFGLEGVQAVEDGGTLSLGGRTLAFLETRMLHWPDSMATYLVEEKLLFSNDAFGMHLASSQRYADEIEESLLAWEAAKYYANILLPYSKLVPRLVEKIREAGIEIRTLAPSHGPIWRRDPDKVVGWYMRWASGERARKAVVVYDTMWQSTAKMARAIAEGLAEEGIPTKVMPLRASHRSDVATELLDAGALIVGSPTLNNGIFPTVADLLTYLKGLRPRGLVAAAFGSYGWGGEAVGQVAAELAAMKAELVGDGLKVQYVPDQGALQQCRALGRQVAERLKTAAAARAPD